MFRGLVCDPAGNLISAAPPSRPAHRFDYNAVNLEAAYDPPDIGLPADVTRREYNRARQLTAIVRPDGQRIELAYDRGGRLATVTTARGSRSLGYDPGTGHLVALSAEDGTGLMFDYDADLLTAEHLSGEVTGSVGFGYDTERRIKSLTVNGSDAIDYTYDPDGLLTQAGALALARDPASGLLAGTTLDQMSTARGYNAFAELTQQSASAAGTGVYALDLKRDKLGRITDKTETVAGETHAYEYGYDLAGRLETVTRDGATVSTYTYDANGNRLSHNGTTGTYDAQDRLLTYGNASYAYTANGELQTKTENGATTTYDYDVLGNLRTVTLPGDVTIDYVIDGRDRQVGKKVNGTLVQAFLYQDPLNPVAELDGSGNVVSRFVYGSKFNVPDYMIKSGVTYRIISDQLGSPRLVVNSQTGEVVQRMDYDEFGHVVLDTHPGFQPFGFAGGLYDRDTGLVRFGARDYDPQTGRWTVKDPILFAGGDANLYGYVLNDPINVVDPSGTILPIAAIGVGAFVGAVAQGATTALMGGSFREVLSAAAGGALTGATVTAGVLLGGATIGAGLVIEGGSFFGTVGGIIGGFGFDLGLNASTVGDLISGRARAAKTCP
ncbi:MAG: RHS repeat-associated core domain-containing protein [Gammaproteobacteria bacterium]|nr:RHS repeat-associated core domain-containing protein [Gammaproteobacteria bacterium]